MSEHITFTCSLCGKDSWAYAGQAGRYAKCTYCGKKSKVPVVPGKPKKEQPTDELSNSICSNCKRLNTLSRTGGGVWCNWCNKVTLAKKRTGSEKFLETYSDGEKTGYVYILVNSAMKGYVKIGKTRGDPEARAIDLNGTGVPVPFVVAYSVLVGDCHEVESKVHNELSEYRVNDKREFFQISTTKAINILRELAQCHPPE
jgi:DNA-directed RNA polymerase subunit RPC12/RpoP